MRIRVSKWTDSNTIDPDIIVLESVDGVVWHDVHTPDAVAELSDVLFVAEDGALRVDFEDGSPDPWLIASNLPMEVGEDPCVGPTPETSDPELDSICDDGGGFPVLIDGVRWGHLATSTMRNVEGESLWVPCEPPHDDCDQAQLRLHRLIAEWSESEEGSMVSGSFSGQVKEVDELQVCFVAQLDEDGSFFELQPRAGRSDRELVLELADFLDHFVQGGYAATGLSAAIESGHEWAGYLNVLDPSFSETCFGAATVNLMSDGLQN